MIPIFPTFKKLNILDKQEIEKYTTKFPPYSDYNFTSLWSYNTKNKINISLLNHNLIVEFQDYTTDSQFYSIIGNNKIIESINKIFEYLKINKKPLFLKLVPEIVVNNNLEISKDFYVKEDLDNHDYIISSENVSKLQGLKFRNKKGLTNKFKKSYSNHKIVQLDLKEKKHHKDIIAVFEKWKESKEKSTDKLDKGALIKLLESASYFELVVFGLYDKKMIGFSIFENINNEYAIGHFMKGNKEYKGIFEVLYQHNAKHFHSQGIKFLNIEQDMGEKGLRFSKGLWRPTHYLKKYIIEKK